MVLRPISYFLRLVPSLFGGGHQIMAHFGDAQLPQRQVKSTVLGFELNVGPKFGGRRFY